MRGRTRLKANVGLRPREERMSLERNHSRQGIATITAPGWRPAFRIVPLHLRTAARLVLVDRFERTGNVNARSGGSARRQASITAASEFPPQGCVVTCGSPQPCCSIRQHPRRPSFLL